MRVYIGEIHLPDGTYTLVGNESNIDDHAVLEIEIDGEEQLLHAFSTHKEATDKTSLLAELHKVPVTWNVKFIDIELEKYCEFCGKHGHYEDDHT